MRFKSFLITATLLLCTSIVAQPVFASTQSSPGTSGGVKSGESTSNASTSTKKQNVIHPNYDSNDPIQSGCVSARYPANTLGTATFVYNGHTFQVQIRNSSKCSKAWARLWETSGNGDCIYQNGGPASLNVDASDSYQSVAGTQICDGAYTDMVTNNPYQFQAYANDGRGNLALAYQGQFR